MLVTFKPLKVQPDTLEKSIALDMRYSQYVLTMPLFGLVQIQLNSIDVCTGSVEVNPSFKLNNQLTST